MAAKLKSIESLVEVLEEAPRVSLPEIHVRVVRTEIDPILPRELHAFPVYQFDEHGNPLEFTGDSTSPYVFALNQQLDEGQQLTTLLQFITKSVEIVNAQQSSKQNGERLTNTLDLQSPESFLRTEQAIEALLSVAKIEGDSRNIPSFFHSKGWQVALSVAEDLRPNRRSSVNAMKFFRRAYNSDQSVRDVVDRVVFAVVGRGYKLTGASESVRRFSERRVMGLGLHHLIAQSIRDSQLFGTSCMVFAADSDLDARLIRPDAIDFEWRNGRQVILDRLTGDSWSLGENSVSVFRGVEQKHSPFGLSILEPVVGVLNRISVLSRGLRELATILPSNPPSYIKRLYDESTQQVDALRADAEEMLARLFVFPKNYLVVERDELYSPGWELWVPQTAE